MILEVADFLQTKVFAPSTKDTAFLARFSAQRIRFSAVFGAFRGFTPRRKYRGEIAVKRLFI